MKWFHKPSGRLMVATPTLRDELVEHGFRNVSPWTRGVDTDLFRPALDPIYKEMGGVAWPRPFFLNVGRVADLYRTVVAESDRDEGPTKAEALAESVLRLRENLQRMLSRRTPSGIRGYGCTA